LFIWDGLKWDFRNESNLSITENQDLEDVIRMDPSAGGQFITNLLDPVEAQDAATKVYVDSELLSAINDSEAADLDMDPTNELSDLLITGTLLELTNPVQGAVGVDLGATFATDAELTAAIAASDALDLDLDPESEQCDPLIPGTLLELTNPVQRPVRAALGATSP